MLNKVITDLSKDYCPIIHSDRGYHYRWPGWIDRMNKASFTRLMSRKGCSPDNAASEGLFCWLKTELFLSSLGSVFHLKLFSLSLIATSIGTIKNASNCHWVGNVRWSIDVILAFQHSSPRFCPHHRLILFRSGAITRFLLYTSTSSRVIR